MTVAHANALSRLDVLRRAVGTLCALLVFALSVFGASPAAHDWLHHDGAEPEDDGCAVVLFANGVAMPLAHVALPPPPPPRTTQPPPSAAEIFLVPPRYLQQPERGPPASLTP